MSDPDYDVTAGVDDDLSEPDVMIGEIDGVDVAMIDIDGDGTADVIVAESDGELHVTVGDGPDVPSDRDDPYQPANETDGYAPAEPGPYEPVADTEPVQPQGEDPLGVHDGEEVGPDLIVSLPDGDAVNFGPPTIDGDDDGTPDTAVLTEDGQTAYATDTDGDGVPDDVLVFDDQTRELVAQLERRDDVWRPVGDGAEPTTAEFVVPAELAVQSVPIQQTLVDAAAAFWQAAYPGEPWPIDDSGQPYGALILLGVIADDVELAETNRPLTVNAAEMIANYNAAARHWTR